MDTDKIKIFIADDHPIFRSGLRQLMALAGRTSQAEVKNLDAMAAIGCLFQPDVARLDIAMR